MPCLVTDKYATGIKNSGMVKSHAEEFSKVAVEKKSYIILRPVNIQSTDLLEKGHPAKGLDVKVKSSDWGVQSGYVCEDSELSKLFGNEDLVLQNAKEVEKTLSNKIAVKAPLLLTSERLNYLLDIGSIECQDTTSHSNPYSNLSTKAYVGKRKNEVVKNYYFYFFAVTEAMCKDPFKNDLEESNPFYSQLQDLLTPKNIHFILAQFKQIESKSKERYFAFYQKCETENEYSKGESKPIMVLAKSPLEFETDFSSCELKDGYLLPYTSDYDVFAIYPALDRYSNNYAARIQSLNKLKITSQDKFKNAVKTVIDATGARQRRFILPNINLMSCFSLGIKRLINKTLEIIAIIPAEISFGTVQKLTIFVEQILIFQ